MYYKIILESGASSQAWYVLCASEEKALELVRNHPNALIDTSSNVIESGVAPAGIQLVEDTPVLWAP